MLGDKSFFVANLVKHGILYTIGYHDILGAEQPICKGYLGMKEKQKKEDSVELNSRKQALDATLALIDKQYGKGSIMLLGQSGSVEAEAISTGSILIDQAIGINGFPRGRIVEVYGPEATGKTTLALNVIAQAQKEGGTCAFIDAEHALDPAYASKIGINTADLLISQPDCGEQALDITEMLVRSGALDVIVVDSVAALVPRAELEGDMGDVHMGLQARLMSQALRKLTSVVHKSKTILIFINQVRQNIGAMAFAPKETTTGGNALKFYSSLRLEVRRIESIKKSDVHIGNRVIVKVMKNKMAPPFKNAVVNIIFGEGISKEHDLFEAALKCGIIQQSGSWFSMGAEKIAQGKDQVCQTIKTNKDFSEKLYNEVSAVFEDLKQEAKNK